MSPLQLLRTCLLGVFVIATASRRHTAQRSSRELLVDSEPEPHMKNQDVQVFIHVHCRAQWARILEEQLYALLWSGLLARASVVRVYINKQNNTHLGYAENLGDIFGPKLDVTFLTNDTSFERVTLGDLRNHIQPTTHVLYIHTKGVTKGEGDYAVHYWRLYMEYFLIRHWPTCLCMLASGQYDTVGVNLRLQPTWPFPNHYSGNFWWTTGQWWLQLNETIGSSYTDPENHLLNAMKDTNVKPRPANIADSAAADYNLYLAQMLPSMYAGAANWTQADAVGCRQYLLPP